MANQSSHKKHLRIHLISDSSGNLIEHIFKAILTQFPHNSFHIHCHSFIDHKVKAKSLIRKIEAGIVCYSIVDSEIQDALIAECRHFDYPCWDVTTPTVSFIEKYTGILRATDPQPIHTLDSSYMGRMEAIEFALQHDDNRRIEQLRDADIILVGISRVSKSPTSLFLAYRGFKVANVSWSPLEGMPVQLARYRRKNVIALTMQPRKLAAIRQRRFAKWDLKDFSYGDTAAVIHESRAAEEYYARKGWPMIDTTQLAVEETSSLILDELGLKDKIFN